MLISLELNSLKKLVSVELDFKKLISLKHNLLGETNFFKLNLLKKQISLELDLVQMLISGCSIY